jgi:hypothetical protein
LTERRRDSGAAITESRTIFGIRQENEGPTRRRDGRISPSITNYCPGVKTMATAKQIAANAMNAQKSTGPKTTAGKEEAAGNALKHGMTATKYLQRTKILKTSKLFNLRRRKLYQADDPVIDDLVLKITLAHLRVDRGFQAEARILKSGSLVDAFESY